MSVYVSSLGWDVNVSPMGWDASVPSMVPDTDLSKENCV